MYACARFRFPAAIAAVALAACSSGSPATPGGSTAGAHARKGTLALHVRVPRKHRPHVRAGTRYISPATAAMTIAISGPVSEDQTVSLEPSASGCTSTLSTTACTLTIPNLAPCAGATNCYAISIATYDAVSCATACTIPPGANELSANQNFAFTIAAGQTNAIGITLDGIPTGVAFIPTQSSMTGSVASGFTMTKCGPDTVTVVGIDADGNYILGPGAPTPSLQSGSPALAVATPSPSSPNAFALTHTISPSPQSGLTLTAGVTPLPGASAAPQSVQIPIAISGGAQICGVVTEYAAPTASAGLKRIATAFDGTLWFTESSVSRIGKITTGGIATDYATPTSAAAPFGIAECGDDTMYFTESGASKVGIVNASGQMTEYATPTSGAAPAEIVRINSDFIFTETNADNIGRVLSGGSVPVETSVNTPNALPFAVAAGPDGNAWFTERPVGSDRIANITTNLTGENDYTLAAGGLDSIAAGPDGNLWFTQSNAGEIGSITTTGTPIDEYTLAVGTSPTNIAAGPDGNLWYTAGNVVGGITTAGVAVAKYTVAGATLGGITKGPDGDLWFVDSGNNKIGRLQ